MVKIPLRQKAILGIVAGQVNRPDFATKEIAEKVFEKPILTKSLLKLAFWMSDYYGASLVSVLQTIIPSGITKKRREVLLDSFPKHDLEKPHKLTMEQEKVFTQIAKDLCGKHLIFGVTGSGKTEIYMRLIEKTLANKQQAIILVPEVALTPQTMERFVRRFGDRVVLLHSYLKETERFQNWKDIFDSKKDIIIGSRSALFAPCQNLGLIIIDEEHETSYKQDKTPRYQTVKTAEKLAEFSGSGLVLGSATPSFTTFFKAESGNYTLHRLSKRIVQTNLPPVEIVDMRNEFKAGNSSIFSERLQLLLTETLENRKQVILFINRRGMSTFVSCRDCGFVEKCPNCDLPLTYHLEGSKLHCHHCGFNKAVSACCPNCHSLAFKFFGAGTQRIETELKKFYGNKYSIARMDKDTTRKSGSHKELYDSFANKEADILIGTQMVAKGLDLDNVGLVGIISADTILNFPDYTASERTFDLLAQVAGRTGRGNDQGKVIIQTYNPESPAVKYAAKHDYEGFYRSEIKNREELTYPPFAKLIKLMYNNFVQSKAETESKVFSEKVKNILEDNSLPFKMIGPSPAFIPKLGNKYYYQITVKLLTDVEADLINSVKLIKEAASDGWLIDVEPGDLI